MLPVSGPGSTEATRIICARSLSCVGSASGKRSARSWAVASIPRPGLRGQPIRPIEGQVPDLIDLPAQCRFYSRCPLAHDACRKLITMRKAGEGRAARCVLVGEEEA